jgi:AbrB family looped-hinge helix DNA binding protein
MLVSKLTQKYQATVPTKVRDVLNLKAGDSIVYEVRKGNVIVRKATPIDLEYLKGLQSTLNEWNSKFDEEAYRAL